MQRNLISATDSSFDAYTYSAVECFSLVWMELLMAIVAAITYLMLYRRSTRSTPMKTKMAPKPSAASCQKQGVATDHEPTTSQLAAKALRHGKMREAITLIKQIPANPGDRIPANMAFRLLTATARNAKFEG
jgi:hypothetical protein